MKLIYFLPKKDKKYIFSRILLTCLMFVGFLAFFSALWYHFVYGDIGFDGLFFTLVAGMGGVQQGLVISWALRGLLPTVLATVAAFFLLLFVPYKKGKNKEQREFKKIRTVALSLAVAVFISFFATAGGLANMYVWIGNLFVETDIYEEEYVAPENANITFPEQKRNLIYIFLESMETTFFSQETGGANKDNCLPNLHKLASDNINFSQNSSVGGGRDSEGASWTSAAMVSHTAGIPMRFPLSVKGKLDGDILPSAVNLTEILEQQGYDQAVLFGSNAEYGGRKMFFEKRGMDRFYDIYTAYEDGIVPKDYWEWWGMEDIHLFEYAKKVLPKMASGSEPFSLTMLTADTHHVDGYKCKYCDDEFDEQYSNVLACSDRQVYEFVAWIQQQDFYENTTIIITGDHATMDYRYIVENTDTDYTRRIYNCFINSAVSGENSKNREFITCDMFPTTLAAMGCTIEGDRLGLGTNLFSGKETLTEKYGYEKLNRELSKRSEFYNTKFDLKDKL